MFYCHHVGFPHCRGFIPQTQSLSKTAEVLRVWKRIFARCLGAPEVFTIIRYEYYWIQKRRLPIPWPVKWRLKYAENQLASWNLNGEVSFLEDQKPMDIYLQFVRKGWVFVRFDIFFNTEKWHLQRVPHQSGCGFQLCGSLSTFSCPFRALFVPSDESYGDTWLVVKRWFKQIAMESIKGSWKVLIPCHPGMWHGR